MNAKERFAARKVQQAETTKVVETETVEYESAQPVEVAERHDAEGKRRAKASGAFGDIRVWFYAPQETMDTIGEGEVIDFVLDEADKIEQRKGSGHFAHSFVIGDGDTSDQVLAIVTLPEDVEVDSVHLTF